MAQCTLLVNEIFRKPHPEIIPSGDYSWFIIKKELHEDVPLKILFIDTKISFEIRFFYMFSIFFISNIFLIFFYILNRFYLLRQRIRFNY